MSTIYLKKENNMHELLNKLRAYNNRFNSMLEYSRKSLTGKEVVEFISFFTNEYIESLEQVSLKMNNKLNDVDKLLILLHIARERGYKRPYGAYAYKELEDIILDLGLGTPSINLTELMVKITRVCLNCYN